MFLLCEKLNPVLLNKNHKKCSPELVQSAVVQTSSARKRQNQSWKFSFICYYVEHKSLPPFLFILYPSLTHHLPNLLWNCALSWENKSKFLYAVEIFRLFYSLCDSRNTGERTQKRKHGQKSLDTTVFLTRQFIHFPITGQEKIIITQLCHETVTDKFDTYFQ